MSEPREFLAEDLTHLGQLAQKVGELVDFYNARLVVEVWADNDSGPIAWLELHPSDSGDSARIRFVRDDEASETNA